MTTTDWKQQHANDAEQAVFHPLVQDVIDEACANLKLGEFERTMALNKIATYAAQVARAQALGFDPELLRSTPDEANSHLLAVAARAAAAGVPVHMLDAAGERRT